MAVKILVWTGIVALFAAIAVSVINSASNQKTMDINLDFMGQRAFNVMFGVQNFYADHGSVPRTLEDISPYLVGIPHDETPSASAHVEWEFVEDATSNSDVRTGVLIVRQEQIGDTLNYEEEIEVRLSLLGKSWQILYVGDPATGGYWMRDDDFTIACALASAILLHKELTGNWPPDLNGLDWKYNPLAADVELHGKRDLLYLEGIQHIDDQDWIVLSNAQKRTRFMFPVQGEQSNVAPRITRIDP